MFPLSIWLLSTLLFSTRVDASDSEKGCENAIPELPSFIDWTADLRSASLKAGLPLAGDGGCGDGDAPKRKVLFVGIDGLRASSMVLPLPTFRRLERMGTYSYWANVQSEASTMSGPGWTSMFTGVQATKHLVDGNGDLGDISPDYPTVFKVVKDRYPEKKVAASVSWHPLIDGIIDGQDPDVLDARYKAREDEDMFSQAVEWIKSREYDFIFVDFDDCDGAGHGNIFDPYLPEYRAAVQKTDAMVGVLLDAITLVGKEEEWLIVVTSDHGGDGYSHGAQDEYCLRIPFLVASNSPRVNLGNMPANDPGSHLDVLPTVMHFFDGGSCVDSPYPIKVKDQFRDCAWAKEEDTVVRCKTKGIKATCPRTCGSCDRCVDSTLAFKYKKNAEAPTKKTKCSWTRKDSAVRCNIDGMRDTCRKACDNCLPLYNVDGQVFGFTDYKRDPPPEPPKPPKCVPDPPVCGCENVKQSDYRGNVGATVTGKKCQRWDVQSPHKHTRTPENYPYLAEAENYCRNPDGEDAVWCYTTDKDKRWDYCDVPSCKVE
eukprot:CAMPEP_0194331574 /NCGR_PEP_ID=MMETSP0171-20130528/56010_1 /TAXON_ID=218684 /ORGANISM="Corethron pennatum, Strain L29A3" /LENGTH=541 /DNA_ID=CAMNT_0039093097 /DNA_START=55 /DNA_END=1680 /DNA_ORIENTATION=+